MTQSDSLTGRRGLVIGIANRHSVAYGCARAMRREGAELAVTYLNAKAEPHVRPLAAELGAALCMSCDVQQPGALESVFEAIEARWGRLDFVLHSIAFAPRADLQGRVTDCSLEGFTQAMDISCHSFIRMARLAEPLMHEGGTLLTMSFYGAAKVVPGYNLMGPVKAALEAVVRQLAVELGPAGIRVNALSPGPIRTRAASGLEGFEELLARAEAASPLRRLADIDDVGRAAAFLVGDGGRSQTGDVIPVDGGYHVLG